MPAELYRRAVSLRLFAWILAAVVVVGGGFSWWTVSQISVLQGRIPSGVGGSGEVIVIGTTGTFSIAAGTTQTLSPGRSVPLDVTIINPERQNLTVSHLTVTIRRVTAPGATSAHPCTAADFAVTQAERDLRIPVPALSSVALHDLTRTATELPHITMLDSASNQDGCKTATVTLAYTAEGVSSK